jgi:hypothetical protein
MRIRGPKSFLIAVALIATLAVPGTVVAQQGPAGSAEVNELYVHPSTTQAGGHPDVHLFFRFCDPIPHIIGATNPTGAPVHITTLEPHGLAEDATIMVRGVRGNTAANLLLARARNTTASPNQFDLYDGAGNPVVGNGTYTGGGWVSAAPLHNCVNTATKKQEEMQLRRFLLKLPPGFLGNPEAVNICPLERWVSSDNRQAPGQGCPFETQVGHSNTRTITVPFSSAAPVNAPTGLYRVPPNGLEPARLGTDVLFGDPPGPIPIQIKLRTTGDYGINSAVIDIPKNLGGPQAVIQEIETVLCGYAPCTTPNDPDPSRRAAFYEQPVTVAPLPGARPFFVNPTSCQPAVTRLDAWSWNVPDWMATRESTDVTVPGGAVVQSFTPTGCDNVPFDALMTIEAVDTVENGQAIPRDTDAGKPSAQQVAIDYGGDFANDPIWQSALRNADVTLPEGMTLSPGGGVGLEGCDFAQFGVDAGGQQISDDPPACPPGAEIGTINVDTPVLPDNSLSGKVFFGCNRTSADQPCLTTPGRPTPANPWKLFLYIEGAGLRIKLVGNVDVSESGQIHNVFVNQPQVPFNRLELNLRGGSRSILANPDGPPDLATPDTTDCEPHNGRAVLTGWADTPDLGIDKTTESPMTVTPTNCADAKPFTPSVDQAGSDPEQAGSTTTSFITISRPDGHDDIKYLKLSLPVGAVGSLAAVPHCAFHLAQMGDCPEGTKVGTVKTTVGSGNSLLTTSGSLYLAESNQPDEAATLALVVPAKAGPIDLGKVVVLNAVKLRASDSGVDTITTEIPSILGGVPLHVRKIEIRVDRPGFFINPTGCEPRPLVATFTSASGQTHQSTTMLSAKGCENLPFAPKLRLIAGAKGQNGQLQHPPLTAIVTQSEGQSNIKNSEVILPDLIRPNAVQFNVPGGLCTDAEFAVDACPGPSLVGSARVITPVLPFQLSGPVYVVQEVGSVLPKLYIVLQGKGIEVVLRARNSFLKAVRTINTFEGLPDVPQAYFELKIRGGKGGILNNFYSACGTGSEKAHRKFDYSFTGHNGKAVKKVAYLEQQGCPNAASRTVRASIVTKRIKVNRKGLGRLRVSCSGRRACNGRVTVRGKGVSAASSIKVGARKSKLIQLRFSKGEVRKIRQRKRIRGRANARVSGKKLRTRVMIVPKR